MRLRLGWAVVLVLAGCRSRSPAPAVEPPAEARAAIGGGAAPAPPPPAEPPRAVARIEGHPRLVLTPERVARLKKNAAARTEAYRRVVAGCDEARGAKPIESGYEGWDWGDAMADCAVAWRATGKPEYAAAAVRYWRALADDRKQVGDGLGGDAVVHHDHGYPIRTHGFYAALGWDWLHDAPGVTPELRSHVAGRLVAWLDWYAQSGYRRDDPIANYFTGWMLALSTAAHAMAGEEPRAAALEARLDSLFDGKLKPALGRLAGGDWPEGWQYGDGAAAAVAFYLDGERTARGRDRLAEIPWLRDVVHHHVHALLPDGRTAYDNGDWSQRPTRMPARALDMIAMVLPADDPTGEEARFLARRLREPKDLWPWAQVLADAPGEPERDPRTGPPSWLARGTGLMLARSAWSKDAVFTTFQCGPTFSDADHQHFDQGHVSLVRGEDPLFVDAGDYDSRATINHDTVLVDDGNRSLEYSPNQGGWGTDAHMLRFVDGGDRVYAEGDYTDAWRPMKLEYGAKRSVLRAERAVVFVRPSTLVVYDRVTLADPGWDVRWAVHALGKPKADGSRFAIEQGRSRADVDALVPGPDGARILAEPTNDLDHPYETNRTWTKTFRLEVASPKGSVERRFLHAVQVGPVGEPAARATALAGEGVDGALVPAKGPPTAVIFPRERPAMPGDRARFVGPRTLTAIVVGLRPGGRYAATAAGVSNGCQVTVQPGTGPAADEGGTLAVKVEDCAVR